MKIFHGVLLFLFLISIHYGKYKKVLIFPSPGERILVKIQFKARFLF